jgi:sugar lactone lactonase YvrE
LKRNFRPDATAALLALAACGLFFVSCLTRTEKARGTPAGWRASVSTAAGDGSPGLNDGPAAGARFADPFGVAVAADGTVYVADAGENNRIRKLDARGGVTTLAGGSEAFADGAGANASFSTPSALALDAAGNLYVADTGNNRLRKVTKDGQVSTLNLFDPSAAPQGNVQSTPDNGGAEADTQNTQAAPPSPTGDANAQASADGTNAQASVYAPFELSKPAGLALTPDGSLLVADGANYLLRRCSLSHHLLNGALKTCFRPHI